MATSKKSGGSSKTGAKSSSRGGGSGSAKKASASKSASKGSGSRGSMASGGQKRAAAKSGAKSRAGGTGRSPNAAFMKPMTPSEQLGAVVGASPMPRTEVTKKLWAYIKKNNLQDPKERRMINADDKLRPVFGGKRQVSMFDMTKLVNQHLK